MFHRIAEITAPLSSGCWSSSPRRRSSSPTRPPSASRRRARRAPPGCGASSLATSASKELIAYVFSGAARARRRCGCSPTPTASSLVDGYHGYNGVTVPGGRERAGCIAHSRRKFFDAQSSALRGRQEGDGLHPRDLQGRARALDAGPARNTRAPRHAPDAEHAPSWRSSRRGSRPSTRAPAARARWATAIAYALGQWNALTLFLDRPHLPVDNNAVRECPASCSSRTERTSCSSGTTTAGETPGWPLLARHDLRGERSEPDRLPRRRADARADSPGLAHRRTPAAQLGAVALEHLLIADIAASTSNPPSGLLFGMGTVFLGIILVAKDMEAAGILSRDEVEDPLSEALEEAGVGEVTGGGGGLGKYTIDVEVSRWRFRKALNVIRAAMREAHAPSSPRSSSVMSLTRRPSASTRTRLGRQHVLRRGGYGTDAGTCRAPRGGQRRWVRGRSPCRALAVLLPPALGSLERQVRETPTGSRALRRHFAPPRAAENGEPYQARGRTHGADEGASNPRGLLRAPDAPSGALPPARRLARLEHAVSERKRPSGLNGGRPGEGDGTPLVHCDSKQSGGTIHSDRPAAPDSTTG